MKTKKTMKIRKQKWPLFAFSLLFSFFLFFFDRTFSHANPMPPGNKTSATSSQHAPSVKKRLSRPLLTRIVLLATEDIALWNGMLIQAPHDRRRNASRVDDNQCKITSKIDWQEIKKGKSIVIHGMTPTDVPRCIKLLVQSSGVHTIDHLVCCGSIHGGMTRAEFNTTFQSLGFDVFDIKIPRSAL